MLERHFELNIKKIIEPTPIKKNGGLSETNNAKSPLKDATLRQLIFSGICACFALSAHSGKRITKSKVPIRPDEIDVMTNGFKE